MCNRGGGEEMGEMDGADAIVGWFVGLWTDGMRETGLMRIRRWEQENDVVDTVDTGRQNDEVDVGNMTKRRGGGWSLRETSGRLGCN